MKQLLIYIFFIALMSITVKKMDAMMDQPSVLRYEGVEHAENKMAERPVIQINDATHLR